MVAPSPFVYWAQDADNIFLKVDLRDVSDRNINLDKASLSLAANGVGARGHSYYSFTLQFYSDLVEKDDVHSTKVTPQVIEFTLKKQETGWWPRLIKHQQKPAWLKIDFERWKCEDDDLSENDMAGTRDIMGDYPELYEQLKKDELGYVKEDFKKVYLVFYNLAQFVFFTYILIVMSIRWSRDGPESMAGTYEAVGGILKFAQLLQYLEVMHPLFGYTKGSVLVVFIQVTARNLVLFAMIDAEPRMQTKPVVFYLFLAWSSIEVVRYPYYISEVCKLHIGFLTWLRYTIWIPLYPLGFLCEGMIILRNIPYFEETKRFSIALPNALNFSFHCPTVMKIYLLVLFFPGMYTLMSHMHKNRIKKIGPKKLKSQ